MPVEVLEMVIKVSLTEEQAKSADQPVDPQENTAFDKESLMEEVLEQLIAYLENKSER